MKISLTQLYPALMRVEKPARYVGGEYNEIVKPAGVGPGAAAVRMALAFPDVYEIGVSYHGFRILYEIVNAHEGWAAERVYAPWPDFEAQLRDARIPLYALESLSPLAEFDVIGFTLQAEVNYANVVNMLDLADLPVRSVDRISATEGGFSNPPPDDANEPPPSKADRNVRPPLRYPLIIAGGEGALAPEPMSRFIDAFVIGDGEDAICEILSTVEAYKNEARGEKRELLDRLARIDGVYVPSELEFDYHADGAIGARRFRGRAQGGERAAPVVRRRVWDLRNDIGAVHSIVPNLRAVHDRQVVEIRRGCSRGCRFCHAGMTNRPVRERTSEQVSAAARAGLAATGYTDLALLSLSSTDHTRIRPMLASLVDEFAARNVSVSLPSLRIDSFDIGLAAEISKVRKTGFTFAPEAGTERLRAVINKPLDDATFIDLVRQVLELGWSTVKFYFMIGLPTETDEDLDGIVQIVREAERVGRRVWRKRLQLNVTLSPFVPKAHTPFQWAAQIPMREIERRNRLVVNGLRSPHIEVRFADPQASFLEAVLARGDRRMGAAIERAWRLGAKFDGWREHFRFDLWRQAFAEEGLEMEWYANRERALDETLPWDHIDSGPGKAFLKKEWGLALRAVTVPDCARTECAGCRACRDREDLSGDGGRVFQPAAGEPPAFIPHSGGLENPPSVTTVENPPFVADRRGHILAGAYGDAPESQTPRTQRQPRQERSDTPTASAARLRLFFSKTGRLQFISHLDLVEVLSATIARARLPIAFSQGFHPRPVMSLPPPLSLGYGALEEPLDLFLAAPVEPEAARRALNAAAPEGLQFARAEAVGVDAPSMAKSFVAAEYLIELPLECRTGVPPVENGAEACRRGVPPGDGNSERQAGRLPYDEGRQAGRLSYAEALERFAAAPAWPFTKETKKATRELDLKASIHIGELRDGPPLNGGATIQLLVSLDQDKYVEPLQALGAILGQPLALANGVRVTRRRIVM